MTRFSHPSEDVATVMASGQEVYLTKRFWDGYSSSSDRHARHKFLVIELGRKWFKFRHVHNSTRMTSGAEAEDRWITWKEFGAFGISIDPPH